MNNSNRINLNTSVSDQLTYTYRGPIPKQFRNKVKNTYTKKNNLKNPRILSKATVSTDNHADTKDIVQKIQENEENAAIIKNKKIAYLGNITNTDINLSKNSKEGTSVTRTTRTNIFQNNLNLGNPHPELHSYQLQKGVGKKLMDHIIEDLRGKGFQMIILHAANKKLVSYYNKFGFQEFPKQVKMMNINGMIFYYGSEDTGPIMYLNL
jgi:hypothetical protein